MALRNRSPSALFTGSSSGLAPSTPWQWMSRWQPAMTGALQPETIRRPAGKRRLLPHTGISPVLGRDFKARPTINSRAPNVVVLSDRFMAARASPADRAIVGRQVKLDDNLFTVIASCPVRLRTPWPLQRSCGRRYSTTPHFLLTAETGVITCRWLAGCAGASPAIRPGTNSM